ncbi:hypothetical protein COCVIDRAFT_21098 [Bipolaris victoriae FI3]|uniref:Uncharacterized protein n=1 Tax=Bipolaris victoriae (strain FI3) TaxID=930091 RepID=W7DRM6_BIPV3|nr:hypothetical protein COCVIDRAFT_21098 [Bipolaris victoriae FI3]
MATRNSFKTTMEKPGQNKLALSFSYRVLDDDDIDLLTYGSSKYAFVTDGDTLVIYDPDKDLYADCFQPKNLYWTTLTITSVVADKDDFFVGMSDGRVFSCSKTSSGYEYNRYIGTIPGAFVDDEKANQKPETLLGVNENWLVYQSTCPRLVFRSRESQLNSKPTFSRSFTGKIIAHAFCSDTSVLRVVVREDKRRYKLYKIDPNKERNKQVFKLQVKNDSDTLLAVSDKGDMAFAALNGLHIYRPETGDNSPGFTHLDPLTSSLQASRYGDACFAAYHGSEYFILCIGGAIGIAKKHPEKWESVCYCSNRAQQRSAEFEISEAKYPYSEDPKMDDQGRLVLRLVNDPNSNDKEQRILFSSSFMTDNDL